MEQKVNIRHAWNLLSRAYQDKHRISTTSAHYGPSVPSEDRLKLLGNIRGKRVLEIGCGGGQNSIYFAKRGAIATGLDLSDKQLKFAERLAEKEGVEVDFIRGNMSDMKEIESESFDIVFSACAVYYAPIKQTFKEVSRVLKKDGMFVFSEIHPFYQIFADDELTIERSYFKTGYEEWDWWYVEGGEDKHIKFAGYVNTMSDYINTLIENHFQIEKVLEPEPVEVDTMHDYSEDYPPERLQMIPGTIIFVAGKT